jgi:hypothetical protein
VWSRCHTTTPYVLAMVSALGDRWHPEARTDAVRADDELRETLIWRVFEVEGGGEVSLANVDKYSRPEASWAQTFRDLVADGTLPRDRVLASCLQALGRDFSAYRAGWFAQLHRSLEPTVEELAAAQGPLRGLLRSPITATVSFAVSGLAVVDKAGRLADEPYAAECAPAMGVSAKATAIRAVDIAAGVARRRQELAAPVAEAVAHALEHPHRDVQVRALAVLRTLDARGLVAPRLGLLEPSVARDVAGWLGAPAPAAIILADVPTTAPVVVAVDGDGVADVSLAERGAALLAGETDAFTIELFLAGVVSHPGVAAELAALRKQAGKVLANPNAGDLRQRLAEVVLAAIGEPPPAPAVRQGVNAVHGDLLTGRLAEIVDLLAGRSPAQVLLATPTDPAGWIDPVVFMARLTTVDRTPAHFDLVAALLRLATIGREDALSAAAGVSGEAGAVVRYALGGPMDTIRNRSLWLAAARGRTPFDAHPHLLRAGLAGGGAGSAATYGLMMEPTTSQYDERGRTRTVTWWRASLTVAPESGIEHADRPTVVAAKSADEWSTLGADWVPWSATVWPHDAEPLFAREFFDLWLASGVYPQVTYGTEAILTALRTHPGRLGRMAAATLATGLATREVRYRALAVDAFLALVPTGRLPVPLLAEMMAVVAEHCPAKRWAAALRDAGHEAGPSVVAVLTALLPRLPVAHSGLNVLLETLHEESLRLGATPTDHALRAWLTKVSAGSKGSKSARAARALLAEAKQEEAS